MDTTPADPILEHALHALREHGPRVRVVERAPHIGQRRPGAVVEIRNGQHAKRYAAEVKQNVQDATIGAVLLQRPGADHPPLLVAEYIPPAIADKLKENALPFIDAAGNAYIKQTGLFIWIKGNRRRMPEVAGFVKRYVARAFEPAGLKVLFAFLCDPALVDRPFREIAQKADVAHGTVGEVMAELPHRN